MFRITEAKDGSFCLEMQVWTDSLRTEQGEEFSYANSLTMDQLCALERQIHDARIVYMDKELRRIFA